MLIFIMTCMLSICESLNPFVTGNTHVCDCLFIVVKIPRLWRVKRPSPCLHVLLHLVYTFFFTLSTCSFFPLNRDTKYDSFCLFSFRKKQERQTAAAAAAASQDSDSESLYRTTTRSNGTRTSAGSLTRPDANLRSRLRTARSPGAKLTPRVCILLF